MICSICKKPIPVTWFGWEHGNNAAPVNDGRCCDECNDNVVLPARINMLHRPKGGLNDEKEQGIKK